MPSFELRVERKIEKIYLMLVALCPNVLDKTALVALTEEMRQIDVRTPSQL